MVVGSDAKARVWSERVLTGAPECVCGGCVVCMQAMVTQWGMSDAMGLVHYSKDDQSPETRATIDREVRHGSSTHSIGDESRVLRDAEPTPTPAPGGSRGV